MPSQVFSLLFPLLFKFIDVKGKKTHSSSFTVSPSSPVTPWRAAFWNGLRKADVRATWLPSVTTGTTRLRWLRAQRPGFKFSTSVTWNYSYLPGDWVRRKSPVNVMLKKCLPYPFFPPTTKHTHSVWSHKVLLSNIFLLLSRCTLYPSLPCSYPYRLMSMDPIHRPPCVSKAESQRDVREGNRVVGGARKGWGQQFEYPASASCAHQPEATALLKVASSEWQALLASEDHSIHFSHCSWGGNFTIWEPALSLEISSTSYPHHFKQM